MADFSGLRRELVRASRAALEELWAGNPDEHFYAFALYDSEDINGPSPSANSEEKFDWLWGRRKRKTPRDRASARWGTAEWGYEAVGCEHFHPAGEILRDLERATPSRHAYKAEAMAAMTGALRDLAAEGFLGGVTAFVSVSDWDGSPWLELESARRINPPGVFAAFEADWRLLYPDYAEGPSEVRDRFREIVQGWRLPT